MDTVKTVDDSIAVIPQTDDGQEISQQVNMVSRVKTGVDTESFLSTAPNSRLRIDHGTVTNSNMLLTAQSLHKDDFRKLLTLILESICKILHTDVNNSCFSLRMIFY